MDIKILKRPFFIRNVATSNHIERIFETYGLIYYASGNVRETLRHADFLSDIAYVLDKGTHVVMTDQEAKKWLIDNEYDPLQLSPPLCQGKQNNNYEQEYKKRRDDGLGRIFS